MTQIQQFELEQGEDFSEVVQYLQPDGTTPVNITGWTARMAIADFPGWTEQLVLTDTDGIDFTNPGQGILTINITAAKTMMLVVPPSGRMVYDLILTDTGGGEVKLLKGEMIVSLLVSR